MGRLANLSVRPRGTPEAGDAGLGVPTLPNAATLAALLRSRTVCHGVRDQRHACSAWRTLAKGRHASPVTVDAAWILHQGSGMALLKGTAPQLQLWLASQDHFLDK